MTRHPKTDALDDEQLEQVSGGIVSTGRTTLERDARRSGSTKPTHRDADREGKIIWTENESI